MKLIEQNVDTIEDIQEVVKSDADRILEQMDGEAFFADPKGYLTSVAEEFVRSHLDEIEDGYSEGTLFAKKVLKNVKSKN